MDQSNKLFVGNVAYATEIQTLVDLFAQYGTVTDSYKPQQKGYAFITFETAEQAQAALDALQGKDVDGRELNISLARPKEDRPRRDFGGRNDRPRRDFGGNNRGGGRGGYDRGNDRY
jgi:RNA recognition motif-containing protein